MRVSILGTGYVGLVTGACLAEKGHSVTCIDVDAGKVDRINRGESPIFERGLDELLRKHIGGNLRATVDAEAAIIDSDLTLIAVGTPFDGERIDLTYIKQSARVIGKAIASKAIARKAAQGDPKGGRDAYHVVAVKSTVVPGTTDKVVLPILEEASGRRAGADFGVGMNPEFLTEGEAVGDFMDPDRIVCGGIDDRTRDTLEALYTGFPQAPKLRTNNGTAEMIKYASNALLANLVSFSNELANLGAALGGIDTVDVMRGLHISRYLSIPAAAARGPGKESDAGPGEGTNAGPSAAGKSGAVNKGGTDGLIFPPINSFLMAGCGFGGSCLPKDVSALAAHGQSLGLPMDMLRASLSVNARQPAQIAALLERHFPSLRNRRVTVLGLSFRPDTNDMRESPAIPVIRALLKEGAEVTGYDPAAGEEARRIFGLGLKLAETLEAAVADAEAIVLITRWKEFERVPALIKGRNPQPLFVDGRRMLDKQAFARYEGIGL